MDFTHTYLLVSLILATVVLVTELKDKSATMRCVVASLAVAMFSVPAFILWLILRNYESKTGKRFD